MVSGVCELAHVVGQAQLLARSRSAHILLVPRLQGSEGQCTTVVLLMLTLFETSYQTTDEHVNESCSDRPHVLPGGFCSPLPGPDPANTISASVLVASAFHPSYAEKMMTCAETATDFKGCMIVRKGLEGE